MHRCKRVLGLLTMWFSCIDFFSTIRFGIRLVSSLLWINTRYLAHPVGFFYLLMIRWPTYPIITNASILSFLSFPGEGEPVLVPNVIFIERFFSTPQLKHLTVNCLAWVLENTQRSRTTKAQLLRRLRTSFKGACFLMFLIFLSSCMLLFPTTVFLFFVFCILIIHRYMCTKKKI